MHLQKADDKSRVHIKLRCRTALCQCKLCTTKSQIFLSVILSVIQNNMVMRIKKIIKHLANVDNARQNHSSACASYLRKPLKHIDSRYQQNLVLAFLALYKNI